MLTPLGDLKGFGCSILIGVFAQGRCAAIFHVHVAKNVITLKVLDAIRKIPHRRKAAPRVARTCRALPPPRTFPNLFGEPVFGCYRFSKCVVFICKFQLAVVGVIFATPRQKDAASAIGRRHAQNVRVACRRLLSF
jgi:hypothetical protein